MIGKLLRVLAGALICLAILALAFYCERLRDQYDCQVVSKQ